MKKLVFCALLLLSSTAANSKVLDDSGAKIGDEHLKAVTRAVELIARDPESVLLRDLVLTRSDSFVCGFFNAKNGFGGYAGFKPFYYDVYSKTVTVYDENAEPNLNRIMQITFNYKGCTEALNLPFEMEKD